MLRLCGAFHMAIHLQTISHQEAGVIVIYKALHMQSFTQLQSLVCLYGIVIALITR